ncbi:MAG TPA: HD domain-containing protein [Papillibacter sp.]|jgi:uncharacterized protein|nr:HD domain-containing protein [Papillibacter sp.]
MNRVYLLQCRLLELIQQQDPKAVRDEPLDFERLHVASCGRLGWLLAMERGADPELAAAAAAMHDIGRIVTGRQSGHAEAGYEPAKAFLKESGLFTDEEIDIIATAVRNHSSKTVVGTVIEEIVKDADVIDCYHYGMPFDRSEKKERYENWLKSRVK